MVPSRNKRIDKCSFSFGKKNGRDHRSLIHATHLLQDAFGVLLVGRCSRCVDRSRVSNSFNRRRHLDWGSFGHWNLRSISRSGVGNRFGLGGCGVSGGGHLDDRSGWFRDDRCGNGVGGRSRFWDWGSVGSRSRLRSCNWGGGGIRRRCRCGVNGRSWDRGRSSVGSRGRSRSRGGVRGRRRSWGSVRGRSRSGISSRGRSWSSVRGRSRCRSRDTVRGWSRSGVSSRS